MCRQLFKNALAIALTSFLFGASATRAADNYAVDPVHSSVAFKVSHLGLSYIHGRFNDISGTFIVDSEDASKSSFKLTLKTDSIDTNNKNRDNHLRSPDFFNVKQFPAISFSSTSVKAVDGGYEVTGDLTMHGVTKPITFTLKGGGKAMFPRGVPRTGFSTDLILKRSDFGMEKFQEVLGDEVGVSIGFEGVKR